MAFRLRSHRRVGYSLKTRLYSIIAFLGLLPLLGVAVALLVFDSTSRDNAALDRAARGTIYAERINGLIYAVVMEARGIYLSADWKTAEPFAKNLMRHLSALQEVARTWTAEALASQQSSVEKLARQIDQFVQLRTESVRLAKEESTAAATTFGYTVANRNVRNALQESLSTMARAYEQENVRARSKVEAHAREFMAALVALAVIAFLALFGGVVLVRRGLLTPLLRVRGSMLRLAQGDVATDGDDRRHAPEIGEMEQAITVFRARLLDRDKLNRETRLLSELNEWLQSCNSLRELYDMVGEFFSKLLPDCSGSLYIYANSRDVLENAKAWNGGKMMPAMHPDDCWGLRRGRAYTYGENEIDFLCAHVGPSATGDYCCIPILAHGETIGLLHLGFGCGDQSKEAIAEHRRLGLIWAEQISLAIANVKLRDQLRHQAIRDVLTGLFNRRYMLETCRREFARAERMGQSVSILSIDVDHFKRYNDNHGHDAGDTVLRAVGNCLETTFRSEDVPCRFGGEEFVVLLPGADEGAAALRAEHLRGKIESIVVRYLEKNLPRITISVGVATFPASGDNPQAVLKAADDALYRAKEGGRNRVELSSAGNPSSDAATVQPATARHAPMATVDIAKTAKVRAIGSLVDATDG